MSTGNGFNKVIMYILPSRQEREILFEATRTCIWLKLCLQHVSEICNTTVRHKWFNIIIIRLNILPKRTALSPFSYIEGMADLQFTTLRLLPCFRIEILRSQSIYHLRRPRLPSSHLLLPRPDSIVLNDRIKMSLPLLPLTAATQHHTKMMSHWIIHHLRTFPTE